MVHPPRVSHLLAGLLAARLTLLPLPETLAQTAAPAGTVTLAPKPGANVPELILQADGQSLRAWQLSKTLPKLSLQVPAGATFTPANPFYLQITYLDKGYGRLVVMVKDTSGKWIKPDKITHPALDDTGKWVTSFERWSGTPAAPLEVQLGRERGSDPTLAVASVEVSNQAFADAKFQYLLKEDWNGPYTGPTAPGLNNSTLKGKIMVGYQGWFRTPNDPYDAGWGHWGGIPKGQFSTDMWPETTGYPADVLEKAADVKTTSGRPAYLFSSAWPGTADTHFAWMKQHNIDGAFLQRFLTDGTKALNGRPEWVMGNVRAAANKNGRLWAVEYDISGVPDAKLLDEIKKDWAWLVDTFGIRKDPAYAHENGKPVVFVWGMPVPDRGITPATANAVVDFLKNDPAYGGNYVIAGFPGQWRKLDAAWQDHLKKNDAMLAWMSKSFADDQRDLSALGISYWPHVLPGFSWANLKHIQTGSTEAFTPRAGGEYMRKLVDQVKQAGSDRLFVGMFDEYDESTAIIPMSDDPPMTPSRPGVVAKFFSTEKFQGRPEETNPPQIDLTLDGQPPTKKTPPTNFAVRFEGQIIPPATGAYTFTVEGAPGDSAVLTFGKQKLKIDRFGDGKHTTLQVPLTANVNSIYRLDYVHGDQPGRVRLLWQGPAETAPQPIPATAFIDAWGRFLTNEGQPSDTWMSIAGSWKQPSTTAPLPSPSPHR